MVAKIAPPEDDTLDVFNNVLNERKVHLDFYNSVQEDWRKSIEYYIENKGDPSKVSPLDLLPHTKTDDEAKKRKKSLIGLYSPKKGKTPYEILAKMRRDHGLLCCPSCGEAGVPGTLDHYLPKDEFPEFSIALVNLTPMCSECQGEKGIDYKTKGGLKKYIHPYYDEVDTPLYKVVFFTPYTMPTFSIVVNEDLNEPLLSLVKEHISGINLDVRFKRFCKTKYLHLLKMAKRNRDSSRPIGLNTVIELSLQGEEDKAINCWEAIFYRSVLEDGNLLEFLETGSLPLNL